MDIRLALMAGIDIPIPECQLVIHQPKIRDIAFIGEEDFFKAIQCLTITKDLIAQQDETLLSNTNNFQIFMTIMTEKEAKDRKDNVLDIMQLLFPDYEVFFTPQSILLKGKTDSKFIDINNFEFFQEVIRKIFCFNSDVMSQSTFNPKSETAKKIAEKLNRGRQRVAAQKGETNSSIFVQYLSVLTIAIPSMSLQDLLDLTMYQLFDLMERYGLYINWDIDIKSRLAGASPDSKPDNWMKNIH